MEAIGNMLHSANVDVCFWAEAVHTAIYTLNRTATRTLVGCTPYEAWYKSKPSLSHLRVFGANAYIHIPQAFYKKQKGSIHGIFHSKQGS
jgi:hypothetical protein